MKRNQEGGDGKEKNKKKKNEYPLPQFTTIASSSASLPPPVSTSPLRGEKFTSGISKLANGGNEGVFSKLSIPYKADDNKRALVEKFGTFNFSVQINGAASKNPGKTWEQGMLTPGKGTAYFGVYGSKANSAVPQGKKKGDVYGKVVPDDMTMNRAIVESRAIKYLVDDAYVPKNDDSLVQARGEKTSYWGGLAFGSYLEDITAKRGLGLAGVGSGMRSMVMASKWRMKTDGAIDEKGFGRKMLEHFPQLGNQDMSPHKGASALWDKINTASSSSNKKEFDQLSRYSYGAHIDARKEAKRRFDDKLGKIIAGQPPTNMGGWWGRASVNNDFSKMVDNKNEERKNLRAEYLQHKMNRHGIDNVNGVKRLAKVLFKNQDVGGSLGRADKKTNRAEYFREKNDYVKDFLKNNKF